MTPPALQEHIESLLSRYRDRDERPSRQEVDDLYTDACAAVLSLETEELGLKRRLDKEGAVSDKDLARVGRELDELRRQVRLLRTAVDWTHGTEPVNARPR